METRTKRILPGIGFTLLVALTSTGGLLLAVHFAMRPNPLRARFWLKACRTNSDRRIESSRSVS
ncbi:hypothetical protein GCM10025880_57330 [Methylorubrum aminovorans]|nr:hypothetical protein GCM10025880_57330 [Methylorubrum aminovorans]